MTPSWEDFHDALCEEGLIHIVQRGMKESLCGKPVTDRPVERQRACPLCRSKRRDALGSSGGPSDQV